VSSDGRPPKGVTPSWTGPPCRALILDDDELMVRAVSRTLRSLGLTAEATTDPAEALAAAQREEPHIVVCDLHMPRSCGAQFLTSIADVAPGAMRVLMSADPDFKPEIGSLTEARVHSLLSKSDLGGLAGLLHALLRGRFETPQTSEEREALAQGVAHALGRPQLEDDGHRHRTARWAARVATMMDLPPEEVEQARLGAILHDIGQIAVPKHVFTRAGRLAPHERAQLEDHPSAGARIVDAMPALRIALPVIGAHHERQDGKGYPVGLAGEAIPGAARAFQVADAYDAMTRGRPHAPARSHRDAIAELLADAGRHHDSRAVRALAELGEEGLAAALGS
jgi:putative two-component system response regulator